MTYESLPQEETLLPTKERMESSRQPVSRWPIVHISICSVLAIWTSALLWASSDFYHSRTSQDDAAVWSPLQPLVQYENRRFNQGMYGEWTEYMGRPNETTEAAWDALAQHGIVTLKPSEAAKLQEATILWPDSPTHDEYIVGVEMYHQLHCLDVIRKALWDETHFWEKEYPNEMQAHHVEHCVDYLRQVIVCHWDVGLIPFRWGPDETVYPTFNSTRTCRKHEPLFEWTKARQAGDNMPG